MESRSHLCMVKFLKTIAVLLALQLGGIVAEEECVNIPSNLQYVVIDVTASEVEAGTSIYYTLHGTAANFTQCLPSASKNGYSPLKLASGDALACDPLQDDVTSAIVVAKRGGCTFASKAMVASRAGASGLIIVQNEKEQDPFFMIGDTSSMSPQLPINVAMVDSSALVRLEQSCQDGAQASIWRRERPFYDFSSLFIFTIAVFCVWYSCSRSTEPLLESIVSNRPRRAQDVSDPLIAEQMHEFKGKHVAIFLGFSSIMLVFLFFFIKYFFVVIQIVFSIAGSAGLLWVFSTPLCRLLPKLADTVHSKFIAPPSNRVLGVLYVQVADMRMSDVVLFIPSFSVGIIWFCFRFSSWSWVLQDVLSFCLCARAIVELKFVRPKPVVILLSAALVYDVFWVFLSPLLFKKSVMVAVATGEGSSNEKPQGMLPMLIAFPRINDWAGGMSLLGLGDIVLPSFLVSLTARMDVIRTKQQCSIFKGYFGATMLGYALGLACANIMVFFIGAQPALLYLSPGTIVALYLVAKRRQEWPAILNQQFDKIQSNPGEEMEVATEMDEEMADEREESGLLANVQGGSTEDSPTPKTAFA